MKLKHVLVIVPEYGHRSLTQQCVDSIPELPDKDYLISVWVGDDAYPNRQLDIPNIFTEVISWKENVGFAENVNRTVLKATEIFNSVQENIAYASKLLANTTFEHTDEFHPTQTDEIVLVILNNDTEWIGDGLERIVEYVAENEVIAGPAIEVTEGYYDSRLGMGPHKQMFGPEKFALLNPSRAKSIKIDMVSGCCLVMPLKFWIELGGFDSKNFKAYYEDDDLAIRAKALGYGAYAFYGAKLKHLVNTSYEHPSRSEKSRQQIARSKANFQHKWPEVVWKPTGIYEFLKPITSDDPRVRRRG
jgi:GT2 family glycosyltransferase